MPVLHADSSLSRLIGQLSSGLFGRSFGQWFVCLSAHYWNWLRPDQKSENGKLKGAVSCKRCLVEHYYIIVSLYCFFIVVGWFLFCHGATIKWKPTQLVATCSQRLKFHPRQARCVQLPSIICCFCSAIVIIHALKCNIMKKPLHLTIFKSSTTSTST